MMLAFLVVLIVLLYTFQSLFTRMYSASYDGPHPDHATSVFTICFGGFIGLATLAAGGFSFTPAWQTVAWAAANALMLWLYNVSMIEAGKRGSYAFMMICALFGAIIVPLAADVAFMNERVTLVQGAAIVLMLISFVVMNVRSISFRGLSGAYYLWCALLFMANGLYATIMNLQQGLMGAEQSTEMIVISYLSMALIVAALSILRGRGRTLLQAFRMGKKPALFVLGCCVVATVASNLLLYLLSLMNASVLYTIENGGVIVMSAICSCIFFREKLHWEQVGGIALATLSIVLISL